ncbi:MAG TPA: hypothetical protein VNT79_06235 [Phycisphaerae bacterium]|nr:hypothetical protein [Phycisphaerae bacterium]
MATSIGRLRPPHERTDGDSDSLALDWKFWAETAALSLCFGALIAGAIRLTGREIEVVLFAAAAGLIKIATLVARPQT